jgi:carbonic anhydrase
MEVVGYVTRNVSNYQFDDEVFQDWTSSVTNHDVRVSFPDCSDLFVTWRGTKFTLHQMHIHSASEYTVGGGNYAAEAHLVHASADGELLVLGVFLDTAGSDPEVGFRNSFLKKLYKKIDGSFDGEEIHVDAVDTKVLNPYKELLPVGQIFQFTGSLTTPPCTEGVNWFVYERPVPISTRDARYIRELVEAIDGNVLDEQGNSNRAVQPVNNRKIYLIG